MRIKFGKKQNIRNRAQSESHNDPENDVSELPKFDKPTSGLILCSSGYFKDSARICLEQNNGIVLRNVRAKIEGHTFDENELASGNRCHNCVQNITRIEIEQEVPTRKYHTDTGSITLSDTIVDTTPRRIPSRPTWSQL